MTTTEQERCPCRHPGMNIQCGLPKGHDRDHTVLIPTDAPWFPRLNPATEATQ